MGISSNKRIAKNTMLLYVRMLIIMAVSLYTSRVILQVLGIDDYGIYNLVAGFVTLFSFISNALVSSTQRFFNVALGESNQQKYKSVYSTSINIMILFSVIILLGGETLGLWFIKTQINVPADRLYAAEWVFHISLLTFVVNIIRTTFNASIIAHENMSFYAYTSIFEAVARLTIVFCLQMVEGDKLITYAWLYFAVSLLMSLVNWLYCRYRFKECRYSLKLDKKCFKELLGFSSWALLGQSAVVIRNQGESILINRFFSVVANAAMGIANQVTGALDMFVSNFQTAFNPQIVKTYASGEINQHHLLVCRASKFSFYLLLALSLPILFNINIILTIWLSTVPFQANYFCVFIIASHLINALSTPLNTAIFATGKIKNYQIICATIFIFGLILSGVCLWLNCPAYVIAIVGIFVQILLFINRLTHAIRLTLLNPSYFSKKVLAPILIISMCYIPITLLTSLYADGIVQTIIVMCIDILCFCFLTYMFGLDNREKELVRKILLKKLKLARN